jgi:hypothetical protein
LAESLGLEEVLVGLISDHLSEKWAYVREMVTNDRKNMTGVSLYVAPLIYLVFSGTIVTIFLSIGVKEIFLSLVYGPILEEFFKFWIAKRYSLTAFRQIYAFAIFELFLVKFPLILEMPSESMFAGLLFSLPALNFHIATAHAYTSRLFYLRPFFSLAIMILFHVILNFLAESNATDIYFLIMAGIISVCPYFWLLLKFRKHNAN